VLVKADSSIFKEREEEMPFELENCEAVILDEIANPEMKKKDIAKTYALAMMSSDKPNFAKINLAIIERWSERALNDIKIMAWSGKCFDKPVGVVCEVR
jgi:hypothetical protein